MEKQNLEHYFLDVLNAYGLEILEDPSRFAAALGDVSFGKIKHQGTVNMILKDRFLQFFQKINLPDEKATTLITENAIDFISEQHGLDREWATELCIGMAHAVEIYKGFPKTRFILASRKTEPTTPDKEQEIPKSTKHESVSTPPRENHHTLIIRLSVVFGVLLLVIAFFIWNMNRDHTDSSNSLVMESEPTASSTTVNPSIEQSSSPSPLSTTASSTDAPEPSTVDEKFVLQRYKNAGQFYMDFIYYQDLLDQNDIIEQESPSGSNMYYHVPQANSLKEYEAFCHRYFTDDAVQTIINSDSFIERDGKLYVEKHMGFGGQSPYRIELSITDKSSSQIDVTVYEYYDYYPSGGIDTYELSLINQDGNWVWSDTYFLEEPIEVDLS